MSFIHTTFLSKQRFHTVQVRTHTSHYPCRYGPQSTSPKNTKVTVTVTGEGTSYTVPAEINTVHQAWGPSWVGGEVDYPGPWATWKAYLHPTEAGGNYTITAECSECGGDPKYNTTSIINVTFGDVWHCSGQVLSATDAHFHAQWFLERFINVLFWQ